MDTAHHSPSLKNVDLISYQGRYYYGVNFTFYWGGQPVTRTIWFTNSTVFCMNPEPANSGYNLCPAGPAQALFVTLSGNSASVTNPLLGLSLELRLAADNSNGGSLRITVEELNTLNHENNVSAANN